MTIKLSICIATYNRGSFIGETLDSILDQITSEVELVVVDGASPDNTPEVMEQYLLLHPEIRYYREKINSGVDVDYDKAVGYARGEYCWLMTDDDLLRPNAVSRVLSEIQNGIDLVVVNAEVKSADFSKTVEKSLIKLSNDQQFDAISYEKFFEKSAQALSFIGCVVIRREYWLSRNRERYYGTLFIHVGVIFQSPTIKNALVIATPLITIRYGNAMWTARSFEIWMFKWPKLIWSFQDFSDRSKAIVYPHEPWRKVKKLVLQRAVGAYSLAEYNLFLADKVNGISRVFSLGVAIAPAWLINTLASLYCVLFNRSALSGVYDFSRSRHSTWFSRLVARILGV